MNLSDKLNDIQLVANIARASNVNYDLITSLCGKRLGSGYYRAVHEYNMDNRYVIKLEDGASSCNMTEYLMWKELEHLCGDLAWVKKWFAPVKWISPNGRVLVMRKTSEKPDKKRPEKVPNFLWDVKWDNFGWIGNQFVCHDYGQFYNFIDYKKGMQKAHW